MKSQARSIAETMIETGQMPKGPIKKHPELRRAFQLLNRMDAGVSYSPTDLGYQEMKMIEMVKGEINRAEARHMQQMQREVQNQW